MRSAGRRSGRSPADRRPCAVGVAGLVGITALAVVAIMTLRVVSSPPRAVSPLSLPDTAAQTAGPATSAERSAGAELAGTVQASSEPAVEARPVRRTRDLGLQLAPLVGAVLTLAAVAHAQSRRRPAGRPEVALASRAVPVLAGRGPPLLHPS